MIKHKIVEGKNPEEICKELDALSKENWTVWSGLNTTYQIGGAHYSILLTKHNG